MERILYSRRVPSESGKELLVYLSLVALLAMFSVAGCSSESGPDHNYLIGSGAADITGPIVDVEFPGYVRSTHIANGIQTRLTARAFIVGELDESRRLVFVVSDLLDSSHEVRLSVVDNLRENYGDLYSLGNVVLSATHTHSSPAGYSHEGRFREKFFDAVVSGVTEAIVRAHQNLKPGYITTPEEYDTQQYEGGHTIFGRWTLPAYQQEIDRVSRALVSGTAVTDAADQGDLRGMVSSGVLGNDFDEPPAGASFGDIVDAPQASYVQGDTMSVSFWTGHPDNALSKTYVEIQKRDGAEWRTIATENDWFARARWTQASRVFPPLDPLNPFAGPPPTSTEAFTALVVWEIRPSTEIGTYRVLFHGSERSEPGAEARLFAAESPSFEVTRP